MSELVYDLVSTKKRIIGRIHNIVVRLYLLQMSELVYDLVSTKKRIIGRIHKIVIRLNLLQMSELIYDLVVWKGSSGEFIRLLED